MGLEIILFGRRRSDRRSNQNDFFSSLWPQAPISLRIAWPNEFTVVLEDHAAVGTFHFERERRGVLKMCQVLTGEAVSDCVVRPTVDSSGFAHAVIGVE